MKPLIAGSNEMVGSAATRHLMVRKVLLVCGIVSSLLYVATTIIGALVWQGYNSISQSVSELMAIGAPSKPVVDPLFIAVCVLEIGFGVGVWLSAGPKRALRVVGGLLVGFGAFDLVGKFLPVGSMHQREALAAGGATLTDTLHLILAGVDTLFIFLIIGFGAFALGKWFRLYSIGTILVLLVFGFLAAQDAARVAANLPTPYTGLEERINIFGYYLWAAVLAIGLLRAPVEQPQSDSLRLEGRERIIHPEATTNRV